MAREKPFHVGAEGAKRTSNGVKERPIAYKMGVAFCDPHLEFGDSSAKGFLKVFRLAQLIIQYLMHSQDALAQAVEKLQEENGKLNQV